MGSIKLLFNVKTCPKYQGLVWSFDLFDGAITKLKSYQLGLLQLLTHPAKKKGHLEHLGQPDIHTLLQHWSFTEKVNLTTRIIHRGCCKAISCKIEFSLRLAIKINPTMRGLWNWHQLEILLAGFFLHNFDLGTIHVLHQKFEKVTKTSQNVSKTVIGAIEL